MINFTIKKQVRRYLKANHQVRFRDSQALSKPEVLTLARKKMRRELLDNGYVNRELKGLPATTLHKLIQHTDRKNLRRSKRFSVLSKQDLIDSLRASHTIQELNDKSKDQLLALRATQINSNRRNRIKASVKESDEKISKFLFKKMNTVRVVDSKASFNKKKKSSITDYIFNAPQLAAKDIDTYLVRAKAPIQLALKQELLKHNTIKFTFSAKMAFENKVDGGMIDRSISSSQIDIQNTDQLIEAIAKSFSQFMERFENVKLKGSGYTFHKVLQFQLGVSRHNALKGSSFVELPKFITNKKACINPRNENDNKCFKACLTIHQIKNDSSVKDKTHLWRYSKLNKYSKKYEKYDYSKVSYPMKVSHIKAFEKLNNLSINIFMLQDEEIYPLQVSDNFTRNPNGVIDLLFYKNHYSYISNFSRLLAFQYTKHKAKTYFCRRCLQGKTTQRILEEHLDNGCVDMEIAKVVMPIKGNNDKMNFTKYKNMDKHPYVIYADLECGLISKNGDRKYQEHTPLSYCYYIVSADKAQKFIPKLYRGNNVIDHFLTSIREDANILCDKMKDIEPLVMSDEDNKLFNEATHCRFCQEGWYSDGNDKVSVHNYASEEYGGVAHKFCVNAKTKVTLQMNDKEERKFLTTDKCYICKKKVCHFIGDKKVRDHDHITGKFRGAAHSSCNLTASIPKKIPVFFHNLKGYDSHHLVKGLEHCDARKIDVIANTTEKYTSITLDNLEFKDSLSFMLSSLDALGKNLSEEDFYHLPNFWKDADKIKLMKEKGIFPYSWCDSKDKFNVTELPSKEDFDNELTGTYDIYTDGKAKTIDDCKKSSISDEDYERAKSIWKAFNCKTFGDFHDIYLYNDVLLLADIFENFRDTCMKNYQLDPAHYITAPGLSWDALLKMSKVELELLTDYEMHLMIEKGIRGGISMISNRYAKANNQYMEDFEPNQKKQFLMYLDANNLYGGAMRRKLPVGDFKWEDQSSNDKIREWIKDNKQEEIDDRGYIFEVDLKYPKKLHQDHNDYPLAPEKMPATSEMLSPYQTDMIKNLQLNNVECDKLIPNLNNKTKYVIHYRLLKLYLQLGLKITKVHRVISFKHKDWMKEYIDYNTSQRTKAKNDFEKDFYKLMNNSVFGKTMENVRNRINFHLVNNEAKIERLTNKPNYRKPFIRYNENLVGIQLDKIKVCLNKPVYVGLAILDNSKYTMYDFHYNHMMKKYGRDKLKLLFTDTDSLCYSIETEDVYEDMKQDMDIYDFSGYDKSHPLYDPTNKKVVDKFKCELNGLIMKEFVGVKPKVYGYDSNHISKPVCLALENLSEFSSKMYECGETMQKEDSDFHNNMIKAGTLSKDNLNLPEVKKCKGVKKIIVKKNVKVNDYKDCIFDNRVYKCAYNNFATDKHTIYSQVNNKICLSPLDTKRYLVNSIESYAYGHYKIKAGLAG